jgi:hypothetical protein
MATNESFPALSFTEVELASYLPSGWTLAPEPAPEWDAKEGAFRCTVIDGSDLDWPLVVAKKDVDAHGRIPALRRAVDKLDRERFKSFL